MTKRVSLGICTLLAFATGPTLYAKEACGDTRVLYDQRNHLASSGVPDTDFVGVSPDLSFSLEGRSATSAYVKGDFNGDQCVDITFRNTVTNENKVWLMNGTTRTADLAVTPAVASADWRQVATDDFNDDQKSDSSSTTPRRAPSSSG